MQILGEKMYNLNINRQGRLKKVNKTNKIKRYQTTKRVKNDSHIPDFV